MASQKLRININVNGTDRFMDVVDPQMSIQIFKQTIQGRVDAKTPGKSVRRLMTSSRAELLDSLRVGDALRDNDEVIVGTHQFRL